ncbi:MAG: hypothetical protein ACFFDJ_07000 [Candidatus Odinarchaeota archaeon]
MSYFRLWRYWLLAVSVFIIAFGTIMAFLNSTVVFAFFNVQINPVFWGTNPVPPPAQAFQAWVYGAWGATVMGWGITMFFIAYFPFRSQERWAWYCILISVFLWYLLDTGISWWFGVIINVIFNTTIFVLVLIPLLFTWKEMTG